MRPHVKKSKLKAKADILFSRYIRLRMTCEAIGKDNVKCGGVLQCAHIVSRSHYFLRYDPLNALSLCAGHHRYYTTRPFHWVELIKKHFPKNYKHVTKYKNTLSKLNYEEIIKKYSDLCNEYDQPHLE